MLQVLPIEKIVKWCEAKRDLSFDLPVFTRALHSSRTPETLKAYCLEHLPNTNGRVSEGMRCAVVVIVVVFIIGRHSTLLLSFLDE